VKLRADLWHLILSMRNELRELDGTISVAVSALERERGEHPRDRAYSTVRIVRQQARIALRDMEDDRP
jgi:hypothetical protein